MAVHEAMRVKSKVLEYGALRCSRNSFLQIILPEKLQENASDNSQDQKTYIIPIDERPYTVHLKQRYFLGKNFMVYMYNQGSVSAYSSDVQPQCYYQGYIEGHPNSIATLTTCSGLRGMLQFENVSYGIEPLKSTVDFQHMLYKLGNGTSELGIFKKNNRNMKLRQMNYTIFTDEKAVSQAPDLFPLYVEMHIVVDKALYDYLGSDSMIITNRVMEMINLINSVFTQLKVIVVLSSLELWSAKNKIPTSGDANDLLQKFLDWKQSYLSLRPHDVACLFIYRDYPDYMGITFPGKMCVNHYSAGVVLYSKGLTLEAFSVIVIQMLGLSLGIAYDDPTKCHCSEAICVMTPEAIQSTGAKTFSNCSINDFRSFISNVRAKCLQNKPQMQRNPRPVCGNGRVEGNEICDCGNEEQCGPQACCDHTTCELKSQSQCDKGPCCNQCQVFKNCGVDISTFNKKYSGGYKTESSRNAPFACYEEVNAQVDSFGNCGRDQQRRYRLCGWRNLICARLICTYPFRTPYIQPNISVIYAYVQNHTCITLLNTSSAVDPYLVKSGAECDVGRVCVNGQCVEARIIKNESSVCTQQCNGHGVSLMVTKASGKTRKNWLLGFYIALPVLVIVSVIAVAWKSLKKWPTKEKESVDVEYKSEGSTKTYISRSRAESSSQTDATKSMSEDSSQEYTSSN
ncbi:disintegrin and metalloproteinase domain-containing protein 32 [Octodon degus]|uniref:Disintegrin and metalloproteinase domain-containing protein 32 n=1 Tax=Octodon degus TaxID=10160 RepID=A0A6P6EZK2_OCTDE|nr:disintegrin and metalloproteinase domain-containing protein 32 [Octodon degus]